MKILKIRFENIHSLKGEHEIDFGEGILGEAGLFAITGPTGSGKSTLLDVITLALYNRIARVDKAVSNTILEDDGGIMTRNMRSCYAEVEYRVDGQDYRSHWSIERNRNNNLNPRKQELVEVTTGHILESGTKTPEKNQEIIGLSYEQFVKAMVLSQGEFSKLLQAPRNERNKLLEDITGARSYREIGRAVYFRFKGIEKNIDLVESKLEGIELLTPELIAEKNTELKTLTKSKPKIEKAYQAATDKIRIRQEIQTKQTEEKTLEDERLKLNEDFKVFDPYKLKLTNHERLSKYSDNLRDYDSAVKEVNQLKEQLNNLRKSKAGAETQQVSYLDAITAILKEKVDIKTANQKLEAFRNKITTLQAEEKKKEGEATLFQNQLNGFVRNINQLGYELTKAETPEQFTPEFESYKKAVQESINSSGAKSIDELNSQLDSSRESNEKAGDFLVKKEQALKFQKNLETLKSKLKTEEESITKDSKTIESSRKEVAILTEEVEKLEKNLEQHRKHQNLEQYRLQLEPDQPCPLCGSLEHPYASEEPYFDSQEELLKEKKNSLKSKSELVIALSEKNKFQLKNISDLKSEIQTTSEEEVKNKIGLRELAKSLKWDHEESLDTLKGYRVELANSIQKMEKSKRAFQAHSVLDDLEESLKLWKNALSTYVSLKKDRVALYAGDDINGKSNSLSSKITHSIANISSLEKQLKEIDEKLKGTALDKSKKEKELNSIVLKEQLENLQTLRTSILSEEIAHRIRKQQNDLNERKTRISEKEKALQKALKELAEKDDGTLSLEALTAVFDESKKQWDDLLFNIGKITNSLEEDKKSRERQQKVLDELNLLKKDLTLWKTMNDLIGDATGNKFSNFVQDLTLEQLIGFANKRLSEFNDRYLLDIPTADEAEKSDTLKIFDKYMGNARRSVRTLSGGETFLVSLAMAFALSDIAARNVKIESLFIDEGFGTLDPETLDQAITILEKMQGEGDKSVGIISHVSALKERITTQIRLDKGSLGYSTLEVVQ